ncbi:MAG: dihydropteroate synthase [Planctomycetes bacterium]|nr:dihydropteroate synthase [Planctomycetota bacterium]
MESHQTGRPIVAGILNVTPDSFSDGGKFLDPSAAISHARRMIDEGADVIDVGAESTRPGSDRVDQAQQILRLQTVLPAVVAMGAPVSIDTTIARVAEMAIKHGAAIINDVSAGRDDADMFALAAASHVPIVLMHMLGQPRTMQQDPQYADVAAEVREFLVERIAAATAVGVEAENIIVDPGIGFGKKLQHNLALLTGIGKLAELGCPVMIGASRKRFIGELTGQDSPADRLGGTIAACLEAYRNGATIFRVHDVAQVRAALAVAAAAKKTQ